MVCWSQSEPKAKQESNKKQPTAYKTKGSSTPLESRYDMVLTRYVNCITIMHWLHDAQRIFSDSAAAVGRGGYGGLNSRRGAASRLGTLGR